MSAQEKLINIQEKNKSLICLGLDLDTKRMPSENSKSIKGMYEFAMNIISATKDLVCAYKPNMAFYENHGPEGLSLLRSITERIPKDIPIILDGKRGDIGNTASHYAEALYEKYNADWVTLNPYMGYDTIRPFLEYKEKGVFILCLTSNTGAKDFQLIDVGGKPLYQLVAEKVDFWNKEDNCGLVVGATQPEQLKEIRSVASNMPLLIPGVGAQGGSLEKAVIYGTDNFKKLACINVSRSVLYASQGEDYAKKAAEELVKLNIIVDKIRNGEITLDNLEETKPSEEKSEPQSQSTVSYSIPEPKTEATQPMEKITDTKPEPEPEEIKPMPTPQTQSYQTDSQTIETKTENDAKKETDTNLATPDKTETEEANEPQKPFMPKPPPLPKPPKPLPPRPDLIKKREEERQREQQQRGSGSNNNYNRNDNNRNPNSYRDGQNRYNHNRDNRHHNNNFNRNNRFNNQPRQNDQERTDSQNRFGDANRTDEQRRSDSGSTE